MMENYRDIKQEAKDFFAAQPLTDEMESMIAHVYFKHKNIQSYNYFPVGSLFGRFESI